MTEETGMGTAGSDLGAQDEAWVAGGFDQAFWTEELEGLKLATKGRTAALLVIGVLLVLMMPAPAVYIYEGVVVSFLVLGLAHYGFRRARLGSPWAGYLFVTLDFALLAFTVIVLIPVLEPPWTPPMVMRSGTFVYAFLLLAIVAFCYSPRLMMWAGLVGALAWGAGGIWVIGRPGTVVAFGSWQVPAEAYFDPHLLDLSVWFRDGVALIMVAGLLAIVVRRSRRLVVRQAESARERANLARYFPPNIVDELARLEEPLSSVRLQAVAVLFADMVGFTRVSEQEEPERVIRMLREFHARLERAVFDNGGTLDKFLGDGVMATFGTPTKGPHDAANSIASARAMLASIEDWNRERTEAGQAAIQLSIGIHYGDVVLGNIGSERRLEFAVLGDAVNVASRLEELTRSLDCQVVVSDDLVTAVRRQLNGGAETLLSGFRRSSPMEIRGRDERVALWVL